MSADSGVNAALLNLCAQLQDSGSRSAASTQGPSPTSNQLAAVPAPAEPSSTTDGAGAPNTHEASTRHASDYEWLRSALASVEAPEKRVKQLLFHLENRNNEGKPCPLDPEDRLEALTELSDMVEDVNWAAEFALMQGPQRALQMLQHEHATHPLRSDKERTAVGSNADAPQRDAGEGPEESANGASAAELSIQTELAMVVAHSAQLNEPLQAAYQAAHWEGTLLPFMTECVKAVQATMHPPDTRRDASDRANSEPCAMKRSTLLMRLLAALLHACSCLCRDCPSNTIVFIQHGGLGVLADVLTLSRLLPDWATSTDVDETEHAAVTTVGGAIDVRTAQHITNADADEEDSDKVELLAQLLSVARKVAARTCFFTAYLSSTGVSSEDVIHLICQLAEAPSSDEAVQKAAARVLVELVTKSPKAIKEAARRLMPHRLAEWRVSVQRSEGDGAEHDERLHFLDALDAIS